MGQSERLKAIVLRRTNYAEADRVLQLLTPKGRRSVIAKGVRRERSKLAGGIELFAICDVVIRFIGIYWRIMSECSSLMRR